MANPEQIDLLKRGVETWNQWRKEHPDIRPDLSDAPLYQADLRSADLSGAGLSRANLSRADLTGADLSGADLSDANLSTAYLVGTTLSGATLSRADLHRAHLSGANFSGANLNRAGLFSASGSGTYLRGANLSEANLIEVKLLSAKLSGANLDRAKLERADLQRANLRGANLSDANLNGANLRGANLTGCCIYGIAAWNVELEGAKQESLVITPPNEPIITVDNLKVAQFIYLLLNNKEIREAIDTITAKVVLILGRFTPKRKTVLDALRDELRKQNYTPVVFDFKKPASRDLTGTISTLAHLAHFIIVDLTDPRSVPQEVAIVIPQTVVPVQPLILASEREYSLFRDLRERFHWVLPTHSYTDQAHLLATLKEHVIAPAEQKAQELAKR
jgi:uncharacterized protein YjbI with pentapeptide repeats